VLSKKYKGYLIIRFFLKRLFVETWLGQAKPSYPLFSLIILSLFFWLGLTKLREARLGRGTTELREV
jgi:hypothetical protein